MIRGERIAECSSCYRLEDSKIVSDRIEANKDLGERYSEDLVQSTNSSFCEINPVVLDLRVGNICNLRCQSCFPDLSHGVHEDVRLYFKDRPELRTLQNSSSKISSGFELAQLHDVLPSVKEIKLIGREPSFSPQALELLRYCIKQDLAKMIELNVHTNLASDKYEFFELFSDFKKVRFSLSLDGYKKMNEYLRYPSEWNSCIGRLDQFIKQFRESPCVQLALTPVLQITNLFDIPQLLGFLFDEIDVIGNKIDLAPIPLTDPDYLCALILPEKFLKQAQVDFFKFLETRNEEEKRILTKFSSFYRGLSNNKFNPGLLEKYFKITQIYDQNRKQDIREVFPQYSLIHQDGVVSLC